MVWVAYGHTPPFLQPPLDYNIKTFKIPKYIQLQKSQSHL